ncbi:MAG: carbon-nitrogen hydrolase family protein [Propionibacteriales bacterium]|nr:carbon-nitrogen hydrolase family protein [Propionibacteriales bacterium]
MTTTRIAAVAANFGRDLDRCVNKVTRIITDARDAGVGLLVLPHAALGGYLGDLAHPDPRALPPPLDESSAELVKVVRWAGEMVICLGYTEVAVVDGEALTYNTAVCLNGDGVLGRHRKVHQPLGEREATSAGSSFDAFETPLGRIGMLIDYDKTFPEAARSLALDGAALVACLSAWPASVTNRAERMSADRQSRLFDIYDSARAAENQIIWVSSNQTGAMGSLRFLGQAKIVGPGGDVAARTQGKGGMAVADFDIAAEVARSRRTLSHLLERVPGTYRETTGVG